MLKLLTLSTEYGQSIWLDYMDRNLLVRGGLKTLVDEGLRGVTSNPTIFCKALTNTADYDNSIRDLLQADHEMYNATVYQWLTIQDVQLAADILEPVYSSSDGKDGFVSLEVSPHLASDTYATIDAARHLWQFVDRPNLMVKIPATVPGLQAIERLIAESINVNVTMLFSADRYKAVSEAYIRGVSQNPHPDKVASVASFFINQVDTKVDALLEEIGTPESRKLKGCIAIANAKLAYQQFKEAMDSTQYKAQQQRGARPQRLLWASTSTVNVEYSDVLYIEQLIGPDTVNTIPMEAFDAFMSHGELHSTLEADINTAQQQLDTLNELGINLTQITQELEQEEMQKLTESYDQLLSALKNKCFVLAKQYAGKL